MKLKGMNTPLPPTLDFLKPTPFCFLVFNLNVFPSVGHDDFQYFFCIALYIERKNSHFIYTRKREKRKIEELLKLSPVIKTRMKNPVIMYSQINLNGYLGVDKKVVNFTTLTTAENSV